MSDGVGNLGLPSLLVAALLYFVCKIPFLGAVLAFVVHPVLVLIAAVAGAQLLRFGLARTRLLDGAGAETIAS